MNVPNAIRSVLLPFHDAWVYRPGDYLDRLPIVVINGWPSEAGRYVWEAGGKVTVDVYSASMDEAYNIASEIRLTLNGPKITPQGVLDDVFPVEDPADEPNDHEAAVKVSALYGVTYRI